MFATKAANVLQEQPALARHLASLLDRHQEIENELADGTSVFSAERMRELSRLTPVAEAAATAQKLAEEITELQEVARDKTAEAELRAMAREELDEATASLATLEEQLINLLVPPEEGDERAAVLEIRQGTGGLEAGLFAGDLLGMYERYCKKRRWKFDILEHSENEGGGTKNATVAISGDGVYGALKAESGTHRVQRIPVTESLGKVHTSTAVIIVLPAADEAKDSDDELPAVDLEIETFRAGGKGGQSVNTTDSAVRITHKPTGIKVNIQNERSQIENKRQAMILLKARVKAHFDAIADAEAKQQRQVVDTTGARSERIRTYNWADDRISDHRLGGSKFGIPKMMEGELLDEFSEELKAMNFVQRREALIRSLDEK